MSRAVRFKVNPKLRQDLEQSPELQEILRGEVDSGVELVKQLGPVGDSDPGEHYVDQIVGEVGFNEQGRLVGRINARKYTSHWVEFGDKFVHAYAPLRRALEALGLKTRGQE